MMGTHAKATASSKHVEFDLTGMDGGDDERDPLGILGGPSSGHDHRVDTYTAASPSAAAAVASLGPEVSMRSPMVRAPTIRVDRERRDPCEAIDAILRSSKDVRDRISSRQVSDPLCFIEPCKPECCIVLSWCPGVVRVHACVYE